MPVNVGIAAVAFVLVKLISRILVNVPPNTGALVPKLLPAFDSKISDVAAVTDNVVAPPVAVKAPVCVIDPPEVIANVLPTVDAANAVAILLVKLTAFAPLLLKVTAPVNTLLCVKVIAFAPAVKLDVPGTVNTP